MNLKKWKQFESKDFITDYDNPDAPCRNCGGYGQVEDEDGNSEECPECNGFGRLISNDKKNKFDDDNDELFGRPYYSNKDISKDKKKNKFDDGYDDEDINQLLDLLSNYFENQGVDIQLEHDGLDITIYHILNKKDKLSTITKVFNIVKKVKKDILPQYDSEFELWETNDKSPILNFTFTYNEGLGDDNPF